MSIKTLIELDEKELKEVLCKYYGIDTATASINVYHYSGDQREPSYTSVKLTGTPTPKQ